MLPSELVINRVYAVRVCNLLHSSLSDSKSGARSPEFSDFRNLESGEICQLMHVHQKRPMSVNRVVLLSRVHHKHGDFGLHVLQLSRRVHAAVSHAQFDLELTPIR
jgi:hypothetical protein